MVLSTLICKRKQKQMKIKITKVSIFHFILILIGSLLLAFGNVVFLSPALINAGGLNGIAIIIISFLESHEPWFIDLIYNIVIYSLSIILWVIGLIFISKEFAFKTLLSSILFPLATTLFTSCPGVGPWCGTISQAIISSSTDVGGILLCGITGGVLVGAGVALTFVGGGSTGGVDVLSFVLDKYLHIRQSIASFMIDATIIISGMVILFSFDPTSLVKCLVGVISAFITSVLIEYIYIGGQASYQVDIISDKWEEISYFVQEEMGRGATIIPVLGGYKKEERYILRVVFDYRQYQKIREFIFSIDPHAFVTFTNTKAVFGEGFKQGKIPSKQSKNKK